MYDILQCILVSNNEMALFYFIFIFYLKLLHVYIISTMLFDSDSGYRIIGKANVQGRPDAGSIA